MCAEVPLLKPYNSNRYFSTPVISMVPVKILKILCKSMTEITENQISYQQKAGEKQESVFGAEIKFMIYLPDHPSGKLILMFRNEIGHCLPVAF